MKGYFLMLLVLFSIALHAADVDTVIIYSNAMHKEKKCVVIKPDSYKKKKNYYPVVYLLHGYDGYYSNWIKRVPELKKYVDDFQLLIVCPDGDYGSWYFDSPVDSTMRYETHIAIEVPKYIDAHYKTIKDRKARAITGLSMGGHGAFFIAFRHADFFGACGSMSGLMDLQSTKNKYELAKRIGDTVTYINNWKNYSVTGVIENKLSDSLAIIFDCGLSDPFFGDNEKLHQKMLQLKIAHEFTARPGNHSWSYWANSIQYHLLFFKNYFERSKVIK